jgi:hypothetical protein
MVEFGRKVRRIDSVGSVVMERMRVNQSRDDYRLV